MAEIQTEQKIVDDKKNWAELVDDDEDDEEIMARPAEVVAPAPEEKKKSFGPPPVRVKNDRGDYIITRIEIDETKPTQVVNKSKVKTYLITLGSQYLR